MYIVHPGFYLGFLVWGEDVEMTVDGCSYRGRSSLGGSGGMPPPPPPPPRTFFEFEPSESGSEAVLRS